ncbi:MAG: Uma2 family endonuclease [Planctomycetaceae bacterium]|nr:Uma2 family endonuclease [Planctomycetaceae bacterium]
MATLSTKPATMEDFLRAEAEAPEGTRLALIDGEIIEWGAAMTTRNAWHSFVQARLSYLLFRWLDDPLSPIGSLGSGEVRCRLSRDPDQIAGIDVAVWLGKEFEVPPVDPPFYDAPPTLAVEILSPSDTHERIVDKVRIYLNSGVPRVWLIDVELRTVTVCGPDFEPVLFNANHTIDNDSMLPGLVLPIADLFRMKSSSGQPEPQ